MKKRIQIDSAILSFAIILTGFLYQFPGLYPRNQELDHLCDFIGLWMVLKGTWVRMIARGHKKANSQKGNALVGTGIYTVTRNPMYLGSFLMGAGFVLIVWPWWSLPFFAWLFYMRFRRQVVIEESHLRSLFGQEFEDYCRKVNRVFPSFSQMRKVKIKDIVRPAEAFSTKEKFGLLGWPLLAVILETMQEKIVFGVFDIERTITIFVFAAVTFMLIEILKYRFWK